MRLIFDGGCSDPGDFQSEILPQLMKRAYTLVENIPFEGQYRRGWVAALLATSYPEGFEKLVLTTPMGYQPDPGNAEWTRPSHCRTKR